MTRTGSAPGTSNPTAEPRSASRPLAMLRSVDLHTRTQHPVGALRNPAAPAPSWAGAPSRSRGSPHKSTAHACAESGPTIISLSLGPGSHKLEP
jgi:hypothetical protein